MQPADEMLQLHSAQNGNVFFFSFFFSDILYDELFAGGSRMPYVLNFSCTEVHTGPVLAVVVVFEV